MVDPAVLQVFSEYETIQAGWDWRGTDRRVGTLGWSPQRHLLFRVHFVVGVETVIAIVIMVVNSGVVAILL